MCDRTGGEGDAVKPDMPGWMRDHAATHAAEQRRNSAQARARRLQTAQAKLAAAKQRQLQVNPVSGTVENM